MKTWGETSGKILLRTRLDSTAIARFYVLGVLMVGCGEMRQIEWISQHPALLFSPSSSSNTNQPSVPKKRCAFQLFQVGGHSFKNQLIVESRLNFGHGLHTIVLKQ